MLASKHDMKHLLLTTIAAVLLVGCATTGQITEKQSIAALQDLFKALDVDKYNRNDFGLLITDDFQIFEKRKKMSLNEFFDFIDSAYSGSTVSSDWELSDFVVSTDKKSAHISYLNEGTFVSKNADGQDEASKIKWLENVYLVKDDGRLKIKFLHSEEIKRETFSANTAARRVKN